MSIRKHAKRIAVEGLGWLLVLVGLAALVLPGPGLLALFAGLALLAIQYDWAKRRVEPVKQAALKTASESVQSWPRIGFSVVVSLTIIAVGITWGIHPDAPSWWPLTNKLWLPGGWGTGGTLIGSGLIALSMVLYSFRKYRPNTSKR
jgi:hypothetical protein